MKQHQAKQKNSCVINREKIGAINHSNVKLKCFSTTIYIDQNSETRDFFKKKLADFFL